MIWYEPFLVAGPGRSGTSFVASVLRDRLDVHMGDSFRDPDETNPDGFCEDIWFRDNNQALLDGRIGTVIWRQSFERLLIDRRSKDVPWGLKDPRLAHVLPLMEPYLRFSRVIRCVRSEEAVVASMRRCYGWTEDEARELTRTRENLLDAQFGSTKPFHNMCKCVGDDDYKCENCRRPRVTIINIDDHPTEEQVTTTLRELVHAGSDPS